MTGRSSLETVVDMHSDGFFKHLLTAFGLALLGYGLMYGCDKHLRTRKGAWEFTFSSTAEGQPALTIDQPFLGISKVRIVFSGEIYDGPNKRLRFDRPGIRLPFGKPVFFDTTYLPGSVTLEAYGHEIEVLPRTLILNFKEHAWKPNELIILQPDEAWTRKAQQATTP